MTTVTANDSILQLIGGLHGVTEIRDSGGNLLAYIAPAHDPLQAAYLEARQNLDPQELARRKASPGPDRTLAEVFQHLKSLETA